MVTYQVSASADDGFARSATDQNTTSAFLYIGDGKDYSTPYHMSAMRFIDINIPRSAHIVEANLKISSIDQEYRGQIYGVIQAESTDDAADFSSRYIAAAGKTAAAVNWDHKFAWDKNTQYTSPDISSVIQEIVNRPGWNSGNSAVVFYSTRADSRKSRMFGSFEAGASFAVMLEVTYETYTISGHILTTEATPFENVTVSAGADIESDVTDATGYYELKVPLGWSGTVTPSKIDWGFTPVNQPYSNVSSDQLNQDFTAFQPKISGYVRTSDNVAVEGVLISADNGGGSDTTDATGYYEITVPYGWSGSVSANLLKWDITPDSYVYSNLTSDQIDQDFTAVYVGIIVKPDGTGDFATIQAAIDAAVNGDVVVLQPGTFTGDGNRDIDFKGKAITVRGATGDPNDCIIDCQGTETNPHRGFKFVSGEDANSVLEGFTITNGYAPNENISGFMRSVGGAIYCNSSGPTINNCIIIYNAVAHYGGGIYNYNSSPTISNCAISNNSAVTFGGGVCNRDNSSPIISNCTISNNAVVHYGGGIYNYSSSSPTIINCTISNNAASTYGGGIYNNDSSPSISNCIISDNSAYFGGGIENYDSSNPTISNCKFSNNSATFSGGGIENYNSYPSINDCAISDNSAAAWGGGICNRESYPIIINCAILNNSATYYGGGIFNYSSIPTITKCAISNNTSSYGGGISNATSSISNIKNCTINNNSATSSGGGIYNPSNSITINNCIIWGNQPSQIYGTATITYSDIQGGSTGVGNIYADPCFVDDYHLSAYSPCIDAGDPDYMSEPNETDIDGDTRVVGRLDMGADEFFAHDSGALFVTMQYYEFQALGIDSNTPPQSLSINNYGELELNWQIEIPDDCNWLSVFPTTGQLNTAESNDVEITVNPNMAGYGTHSCQLQVTAPDAENSPQVVTVNLEVLRPQIGVNKDYFYFTAYGKSDTSMAGQELVITNTGFDTLNWHIEVLDCNWLSIAPQSGQVTDGNSIVLLTVDLSKAPAYGYNYCTINIIDENASNSPKAITVRLQILGPSIYVNPPRGLYIYAESNTSVEGTFEIINTGYDILHWNIETPNDCNWLTSVEPLSGECPAGEYDIVTVAVDANGLENNDYHTQLFIHSPECPSMQVILNLIVYTPNEIHVPRDYQTIQAAIDASSNWDVIEVSPGIYTGNGNRDIDFKGKAITVRSENGPENCIIDIRASQTDWHNGFYFHNGEDKTSIVEGFTITGGYTYQGGGVFCDKSSPSIKNCIITKNISGWGGGIAVANSNASIVNCLISQNEAWDCAGGIFNWYHSNITITNCTIAANTSQYVGAILCYSSDANVNNCILWANTSPGGKEFGLHNSHGTGSSLTLSYSNILGGQSSGVVDSTSVLNWGLGNIDADPCFAESGYWHPNDTLLDANDDFWVDGDYHLKSQTGRWQWSKYIGLDPTGDGFINLSDFAAFANSWQTKGGYIPADLDRSGFVDLSDLKHLLNNYLADYPIGQWATDDVTSPCIDAGDPNSDWTEELWPHGKRINMGAYGGTAQASMSDSNIGNIANLDNDISDVVDYNDLGIFLSKWCRQQVLLTEDLNRDGVVNSIDYAIFANNWLTGLP